MKTNSPLCAYALILIIILSFSIRLAKSQVAAPMSQSIAFSGSNTKLEDAVSRAEVIFVGEIIQIGGPSLSSAGQAEFCGNQVKVLEVFRGSATGQITVSFVIAEKPKEQVPSVGSSYIFFAQKVVHPDPDLYTAFKLLPATDSNETKVKALVAALPAGK
jgi:hypothetical protein